MKDPEQMTRNQLVQELYSLTEKAEQLAGAMEYLIALQNGPPLVKERGEWEAAMKQAAQVLDAYKLMGGQEC
jgi:hypothetical protein